MDASNLYFVYQAPPSADSLLISKSILSKSLRLYVNLKTTNIFAFSFSWVFSSQKEHKEPSYPTTEEEENNGKMKTEFNYRRVIV